MTTITAQSFLPPKRLPKKSLLALIVSSYLTVYASTSQTFADINVSSLTKSQGFHLTGEHPGELFGNTVSAAGDVNNDGIDDIIVGAPQASYGDGAVYVIFGKVNGLNNIGSDRNVSLYFSAGL